MNESIWPALVVIAVGTFLMRVGPLQIMFRRLKQRDGNKTNEQIPFVFSIMGPTVIAAMLGTSLIPTTPSFLSLIATFVGILSSLIMYYKTRTLSLPVLVGVLGYSVVISIQA